MPIPKPKPDESKKAFMDRCVANPTMLEEFPDDDQRYTVCSNQAEITNMSQLLELTTNLKGVKVRNGQMEGRDYLVCPMVMIVEGVLNGSAGPLFYPAEELARNPGIWNHKPVVVYHPEMNGQFVSACSPDILSRQKVGVVMNAFYEDGRLKAEAWLEKERLEKVDNRVLEAIENEEVMEISTGLGGDLDRTPGTWNNRGYDAIVRNFQPDHLAILPDSQGACSVEDGAGLLRNQAAVAANALSHQSLRDALEAKVSELRNPGGENSTYIWVVDVFDDTFIFEEDERMYRMDYMADEDSVSISGTPEEVQRRYEYVAANEDATQRYMNKESTMNREKVINDLIKDSELFNEDSRSFLMNQSDESLEYLQGLVENAENTEETPSEETPAEETEQAEEAPSEETPTTNQAAVTPEEYIANAPAPIQEILNHGLRTHHAAKQALVGKIMNHEANSFTKEQLSNKDISELEALARFCGGEEKEPHQVANYAGQGEVNNNGSGEVEPLGLPVMNFEGGAE